MNILIVLLQSEWSDGTAAVDESATITDGEKDQSQDKGWENSSLDIHKRSRGYRYK